MNEYEDQRLSGLLREVSPARPDPGAWAQIRSRAVAPRPHRTLSSVLTVSLMLVLLGAGGWGVWKLLDSAKPAPILVLQPDGKDLESTTNGTSSVATVADVPPPFGSVEVTAYLEYAVTGRRPLSEDPRFSFVWPSGQEWGLWSGNVEVFPADTDRLPPEFYQQPPDNGPPQLPDFITETATFVDPDSIPRPLWVFATDGDLSPAVGVMQAAAQAGRPVLVVGASIRDVSEVLGIPPDENQSPSDTITARSFVRYVPWNTKPLQAGEFVPVDYYAQPPKEISPTPTPAEVYDVLAAATLQADPPALSEEESTAQAIEDGWYFGFWAGNVEVIPERSAHLPDFFYSGPTPLPAPRTDQPSAFVDPTAINKPLWVMGDEVNPLDFQERIRAAAAADRPVLFYATTEEVAEAAMGIEDNGSGSSAAPLSLQIRPWWPWQAWGGLGIWGGGDAETEAEMSSPAWVFRMLAQCTLQEPRWLDNDPRQEPLSRAELAAILFANYRGIDMVLALPSELPDDFVVAEGYGPTTDAGGASAGSVTPSVVDCPSISATWWGVRYVAGEDGFWLLADLSTAPVGASWREVGATTALGAVSVAEWGDVTWVRVGDGDPALYLVGPKAMEGAMVETAKVMEELTRD